MRGGWKKGLGGWRPVERVRTEEGRKTEYVTHRGRSPRVPATIERNTMSTMNVRPVGGNTILVLSEMHHKRTASGRRCPRCGARWTAERDAQGDFHAWRDGGEADIAIIDWHGNNAAIACCRA